MGLSVYAVKVFLTKLLSILTIVLSKLVLREKIGTAKIEKQLKSVPIQKFSKVNYVVALYCYNICPVKLGLTVRPQAVTKSRRCFMSQLSPLMAPLVKIFLLTFLSVIIVPDQSFGQLSLSPSTALLYGNVLIYSNQSERSIGNCKGEPIYLDYSDAFNSVVIVCNEENQVSICILPINSLHEAKLKAHGMQLRNVGSPLRAFFAFDWVRGLLYYAKEKRIYVANLNKHSEELLLYESNELITINGLVVRPDNSTLLWIEYNSYKNLVVFKESRQDGKDREKIFEKLDTNLEWLHYSRDREMFMALVPKSVGTSRTGFLFQRTNMNKQTQFNISIPNSQVNNVILFENRLIFLTSSLPTQNQLVNYTISQLSLNRDHGVTSVTIIKALLFETKAIAVMSTHLRPKLANQCETSLCNQQQDYCIPHNKSTYICQSNPKRIYKTDDSLEPSVTRAKLILVVVAVVSCLLVMLIALLAILISKKKVRFYQIRLKSISRVNSAKLEPKTEATEEVAE